MEEKKFKNICKVCKGNFNLTMIAKVKSKSDDGVTMDFDTFRTCLPCLVKVVNKYCGGNYRLLEDVPPDFEKTFKENMGEILA